MTANGLRTGSSSSNPMVSTVLASLPMLLLTVALFAAGYVLLGLGVNFGPRVLPLWALLLVLGFVACIGTVISWFFVEGPRPAREMGIAADAAVTTSGRSLDRGRPRPNVGPTVGSSVGGTSKGLEPWDELPVATPSWSEPNFGPSLGPSPAREPAPEDAGRVLEEIDGIEREVAPRRKADASVVR